MEGTLYLLSIIGGIVVILKGFRLWKALKNRGFESKESKTLKKYLGIASFPADDNEFQMFMTLIKTEALRKGGNRVPATEWEATQTLLKGIMPVLQNVHAYMVEKCQRDRGATLEILLTAAATIIQNTGRR